MIFTVYVLCALLGLLCAVLLARAYRRTGSRLLFWSALCFVGMTLQNVFLVADKAIPSFDFSYARILPALAGIVALLYGLIWESR
jgi:hypothetical protein